MQYLALEAVRLKLGPLRASVRLGARLGVCQVDFMIRRGRAATTDRIAHKIVPDFLPRSNEIAGNRRTSHDADHYGYGCRDASAHVRGVPARGRAACGACYGPHGVSYRLGGSGHEL